MAVTPSPNEVLRMLDGLEFDETQADSVRIVYWTTADGMQPVVWPMQLGPIRQGNYLEVNDPTMKSYTHRQDH